jgi:signal transduction histidine kinase
LLPDFRVRQRDYLLEIAQALTQELDLDKLLARILDVSIEVLAGQAGLMALRSEAGEWHMRVSRGLPPAFLRFLEPYLAQIPEYEDPEHNEISILNQVLSELVYAASQGALNGVGLPLVTRQQVLGTIFVFRSYAGVFSANDRMLLSSFANQAAIAVQNAQFYSEVSSQKARMDALLETAADGILILTTALKIERCNAAFSRISALPAVQIQGFPHENIIHLEKITQGLTLEQAVAGGWPLTPHAYLYVEGDLKRPEPQRPIPIGITYAPLLSEEGKLLNVIATVRDITRFRQADELKSTFVSIISHELKTPVALIKGYVSTLRREDAVWDKAIVQESLAVIEEEADRLNNMIENLLDASRLQAGGLSIKRSDVNLADLSRQVAARMQTQTSLHTIMVDFPDDFPVILADENRVRQVLTNLISNAIKYAPDGEIRISGALRSDVVVVTVSDQGPGIAQEDIPHIFDRFYRAPDMARHTKGAGLGLYLTRSIIEAHGGRIWVDPESGKGARICFSLPRGLEYDQ